MFQNLEEISRNTYIPDYPGIELKHCFRTFVECELVCFKNPSISHCLFDYK